MNVYRYKLLFSVISVIILFFLFKIWINISANQYAFNSKIPALRGNIYDSKGRLLATSELVYTAYLDLRYLKSIAGNAFKRDPDFIKMLSNFNVTYEPDDIDGKYLLRLGSFSKKEDIQKKVPAQYLKFLSVEPEERRVSISGFGLNFIIGKTEQRYGISGAEAFFDKILRPVRDGITSISYSGFIGNKTNTIKIEPENGKNVVLTIDSVLQKKLYNFAVKYQQEKEATEVGILIMESNTGKIRVALTTQSWPTYYMGYFEPGSTIKPIIFAAAIELGLAKPDTFYYCPGYVKPIDNLSLTIKDLEKHGDINLYDGLVHSCNVVSILTTKKIVESYGQERLYEILTSFGFGKQTGIELPGEVPGKLNTPDKWYKSDWAFMGIGQSIGVTPVQLLAAFNSIVNDGTYITPSFDEKKPITAKKILSKQTTDMVKQMLLDVVEKGTGVNAKIDGIRVLGKTGTAQKNGKKDVTTLFIGQVELDKKYTILVWVDSPQKEKLSSVVATPFFKSVVLELQNYLSQEDDKDSTTNDSNFVGWTLEQIYVYTRQNGIKLCINRYGLYVESYELKTTPEGTVLSVNLTESPVRNKTN
uniref:Penicillin-binding protein 2 n=1 Tax=Fervidobacterium nodosum TaxID=2424 RepID=A0A7C5U3V1_9BACT